MEEEKKKEHCRKLKRTSEVTTVLTICEPIAFYVLGCPIGLQYSLYKLIKQSHLKPCVCLW